MHIDKSSKISFDPISLLVDGKRWFPMMGEMHFSRCPRKYWEQELLKMKAGGIDIVSLYVIWIHHEEIQGEFDFTGDRNLREFMETVRKCGLYSILRIGPWAHGEARNGGFPDWLLKDGEENGYEVRTDAPRYLEHVRTFYEKIYEQAKGLFIKDNGPVIGIQIENEYGHCGGKTGEEGEQHMKTLRKMALEIGFDAPLYTATGWGGAVTGGMVPVMGGYCEAPWDQRITEIEPSGNYIFTRERNDHNIGSDYGLGVGITFDQNKFPFLTAELGGGLQVTHHRRPIATGLDTAAMTMVKVGCGANLLGYYMYHGGTNPKGKLTTLQETRETGYPNDLPAYSYDFNAPLREYGQMEDAYREVRMIASFIHDFGDDLCDMPYTQQPGNPLKPGNLSDLRTSVRYKTRKDTEGNTINSGYLFVNNYQRRYEMASHKNVEPTAYKEDGSVLKTFAKRDIEDGDFFFYPFNMPFGDSAFITIDATPLCIIHDIDGQGHKGYVFYTDTDREVTFDIDGDAMGNQVIVLTRSEALCSSKVVIEGKEHLIISDGVSVTGTDGTPWLYFEVQKGKNLKPGFRAYPELSRIPEEFIICKKSDRGNTYTNGDAFALYESKSLYENDAEASFEFEDGKGRIKVNGKMPSMNELFMHITYAGDSGIIQKDGEIIADNFYTGQKWEVGLDRFMGANGCAAFDIVINPLNKDDKIYLQEWPRLDGAVACRLEDIELFAQYRIKML